MTPKHTDQLTAVKDTTANPAPLGLMGFGLTTIMLNIHNAGWIAMGGAILALGMFYGGIAQMIAGLMEWKKGNTFGTTAFISYGFFWLSLVAILLFPAFGLASTDKQTMACFLFLWAIFTTYMFVATLNTNRGMQYVFLTLALLFYLLALGDATGMGTITIIAGYVGIACGAGAIYVAMAQVINEAMGRTVVPLWPVTKKQTTTKAEPID